MTALKETMNLSLSVGSGKYSTVRVQVFSVTAGVSSEK
jgi:hypothetical protein